ncbi:Na+/H+ antiporter NhaA [Collinsella sp. zg1085]|uniref:Na+/H+ antiporter NhaA n=1 Tax=Collinsella sp. zg1085 TaxID=2844380 RepID=UPI001C0CCE84|nr:Na+/H+ antiporter NhaA [Collinsella sp. zg1085]QWT17386.1 Na+/H+ antiporter NhaA [Collinsella sp. zg1085]
MENIELVYTNKQQKRLRRKSMYEEITDNGTIAAAVMVLAAVAAVIVANSDAFELVHQLLMMPFGVNIGTLTLTMPLEVFVNDFLMAIFFLLVGIELKFEMTVGELRQPKQALLPMLAAVGGVVAPAAIYAVLNKSGAIHGWAIPMATDIAFALGVLSLLGNRVPAGVRVFFSTLAIADDLLAIVVIALFYGSSPDFLWLGAAAATTLVLWALNHTEHVRLAPYMVLGLVLWFCLFQSGVHATLAGVILAFCVPSGTGLRLSRLTTWLEDAALPELEDNYDEDAHVLGQHEFTATAVELERTIHRVSPPLIRLERAIATPVNFIILPIFAFVNAQVRLVDEPLLALAIDPISIGVYLGMLLGKPLGIFSVTAIMVTTKLAELPERVSLAHIAGVGVLGGIGFTMSILIAGLAFAGEPHEILAAKAAILAGSVTAALAGLLIMRVAVARAGHALDDKGA